MIARLLCNLILFVLAITFLLWGTLQVPAVQEWSKARLQEFVKEKTGITVEVGSFHGFLPFSFGAKKIDISENGQKLLSIDSVSIVPAWFELIFGKLSFLYLSAHGIDLTHIDESPSKKSDFSLDRSLSIYAYRFTEIRLPKKYYDPLLTKRAQEAEVSCFFNLSGSLSWNSKSEKLKTKIKLQPYAGST